MRELADDPVSEVSALLDLFRHPIPEFGGGDEHEVLHIPPVPPQLPDKQAQSQSRRHHREGADGLESQKEKRGRSELWK